ncbi:hypothetical protein [Kytococcus sedentarius]|uniref:hypothetical protein n=1 Tax=Kytococcus sedentarius TaxID=1276 RepID=UPI0035BC4537
MAEASASPLEGEGDGSVAEEDGVPDTGALDGADEVLLDEVLLDEVLLGEVSESDPSSAVHPASANATATNPACPHTPARFILMA